MSTRLFARLAGLRHPGGDRLHSRIAFVLGGLAACLSLALVALWLYSTRMAIHEEIEAAARVSEQMLRVLTARIATGEELVEAVRPLGRVRANELRVLDAAGVEQYHSPAPRYKAGREVPAWFTALLDPQLPARELPVAGLRLRLEPDASRSVLDAWDELRGLGLALAGFLAALCLVVRQALQRAMRPLDQVQAALDRMGHGHFDTRLPIFPSSELGRLARAFNGMADRLKVAVDDNVRLETEREIAVRLQARLEAERRDIARELHDELAQGITAVRALAGAIVQRTPDLPALQAPANGIVAVTGEMQDGVRNILQRLRPVAAAGLVGTLQQLAAGWRQRHPGIALDCTLELGGTPVGDEVSLVLLRCVQEGLTNVIRHAAASRVDLRLSAEGDTLHLSLTDNGRGRQAGLSAQAGCGLGLAGMAERVAALGGCLQFTTPAGGGFGIVLTLPVHPFARKEIA